MATTKFTTNPLVLLDENRGPNVERQSIRSYDERAFKKKVKLVVLDTGKSLGNALTRNRTGG